MEHVNIIGASLAGLYSAKSAAANGAKVTVYEKNGSIGSVLKCGEMFTTIYGRPPSKCITNEIKSWIFDFPDQNRKFIEIKLPEGFAVMTDRSMHEHIMFEECLDLGVRFVFNKKMMRHSLNKPVIIANGARSWNGLKMAVARCVIVKSEHIAKNMTDEAYFEVFDDMSGYNWIFPRGSDNFNIGYGYDKEPENMPKTPSLPGSTVIKRGGGYIPINTDFMNIGNYYADKSGKYLFVGDAAGLVNPMLMGGEHLAALSGAVAGYICASSKDCNEIYQKYHKAMIDIITPEMSMGVMIANMRESLCPNDFYEFFKYTASNRNIELNDVMLSHIRRKMSEHIKAPETTNRELKELM